MLLALDERHGPFLGAFPGRRRPEPLRIPAVRTGCPDQLSDPVLGRENVSAGRDPRISSSTSQE
ncbi:MAG: hypothetical protein MZU95_09065 [Desulfomicrobium escambiense]|nr:hypothetical protein [Desulfomicrobium escambiense]